MTEAPSRILVCGGRDFDNVGHITRVLDFCRPYFALDFCMCSGEAPGADTIAHLWAIKNLVPFFGCPANWNALGKDAGTIRNQWMLKWFQPDLVIAFPGGVGTAHMKKIAKQKGVIVYEG